jgi:hypothetical protein
MENRITEARIMDALIKQEPKEPRRIELGGGYYYKCPWLGCDSDVSTMDNYCSRCGQRLMWGDYDE